jgi:hypothetical protein
MADILDMIDVINGMAPGAVLHIDIDEKGEVLAVDGQKIPEETSDLS